MKAEPWPKELGPGTPVDKARMIGRAFYQACHSSDPRGQATAVLELARRYGEAGWIESTLDTIDPSQRMTRAQVAELGHVDPDTVTTWASRGFGNVRLVRHPDGYDHDEVLAFLRYRDRHRTHIPTMREEPT